MPFVTVSLALLVGFPFTLGRTVFTGREAGGSVGGSVGGGVGGVGVGGVGVGVGVGVGGTEAVWKVWSAEAVVPPKLVATTL